jgi:hypothetical protein
VIGDDVGCDFCVQGGDMALYEWSVAFDFLVKFGR